MEVKVAFRHKSFLFLRSQNQNAGGYTCFVEDIIVTDPNSSKIRIVGEHEPPETNQSVVGLSIRNQGHLQKFPRGFGDIFPNLKYFEIEKSSITLLYKEDFRGLEHLQGLWLPRNPIISIPTDLFENVQGLRYLSFADNKLKYIGHDILKPLKNLQVANFRDNTTIDFYYDGSPDKLIALQNEIVDKCCSVKSMKKDVSNNKNSELEKRVQQLEMEVKKQKSENETQNAKLTQYAGLSQLVDTLLSRIEDLENRMEVY